MCTKARVVDILSPSMSVLAISYLPRFLPPGAAGPGPGSAATQASGEPGSPARTPAQWVEGLVQQMASARDVADARGRAANELRAFEQVVMQTTNRVGPLSRADQTPCSTGCLAFGAAF